ncbi:hypothetical protein FHETE_748 [Fusarium heterosporum]|uniref:Uncharacterized protein n=1 Tax=Fusarium heterosporum TaxID=42747 RepID=A0A8H5TZD4_FUSHE|nr:hypothetical protein FHETE_748 [Fusarium heterosporum]
MGTPNLFENNEKTIQTEEWHSLLSQSADDYENCVVKTITHVRDLRSLVVHEYLQAIIEDLETGERTRLIAERQTGQDQVILGRWRSKKPFSLLSSSSSSRDFSKDLSLPLFSIKFDSNNLKVLDLARILSETTKIGGNYSPYAKNCYWFAITAYKALQLKFSGAEERWYFWKWRGKLIFFKKSAEANEFHEERDSRMQWAPGKPVPTWEFLEEVYKSTIRLQADSSEEAEENIESSDLGLDELYNEVNQSSEVSRFIEVYNEYKDNATEAEHTDESVIVPEDFQLLEPTQGEAEKIDFVTQAMVGEVLANL